MDRIFGTYRARRVKPDVELGFMPEATHRGIEVLLCT